MIHLLILIAVALLFPKTREDFAEECADEGWKYYRFGDED